jgi:hypothetical protein
MIGVTSKRAIAPDAVGRIHYGPSATAELFNQHIANAAAFETGLERLRAKLGQASALKAYQERLSAQWCPVNHLDHTNTCRVLAM